MLGRKLKVEIIDIPIVNQNFPGENETAFYVGVFSILEPRLLINWVVKFEFQIGKNTYLKSRLIWTEKILFHHR